MDRVQVVETVAQLREYREKQFLEGKIVGLVPTMGAIHDGHLSLLTAALDACDSVVVSIFVNPSQFAPNEDLDRYPRTLQADLAKISASVSSILTHKHIVVFVPSADEMYPSGIPLVVSEQKGAFVQVLGVSEQLEGKIRPHFFRGVATIVTKLFNMIQPQLAFFGQKDVQQCIVLKTLVRDLLFNTTIKIIDTLRDPEDGLALSSRNVYLTPEQRKRAPAVYRGISKAVSLYDSRLQSQTQIETKISRADIIQCVYDEIALEGSEYFAVDYVCLSDKITLEELDCVGPTGAILSAAWKMGTTRLIDNAILGDKL